MSVSTYEGKDGVTRASLEVTADEVEFLTPRNEETMGGTDSGFTEVEADDYLPF